MNIFPIRSVRTGKYKYIHNLRPDAYHTNHSDRNRTDGRGVYWDCWDEVAKTDPLAAVIIKRYYTRPEFEFFDLDKDPLELDNLADDPEYKHELAKLRAELSAWTAEQGDELLPHKDPYLTSGPIPDLKPAPMKVKAKRKSK
jgi:N-sulfoglucosamine sulfohydrolase